MDADRLMPPVSRFGGGGSRDKKKQTVTEKLKIFFEKYFGVVSVEMTKEEDNYNWIEISFINGAGRCFYGRKSKCGMERILAR